MQAVTKQVEHTRSDSEISFQDTRIAFAAKTDADLRRSSLLFRFINNNFLVRIGPALTRFAFSLHLPISGLIKATIFRQFCGGETVEESVKTADSLGRFHIASILDYSVEGKQDEHVFDETQAEILRTIKEAATNANIPFAVFKVSGIGDVNILETVSSGRFVEENSTGDLAFKAIKRRVDAICKAGFDAGIPVMIDAEESWIQPAIDDLALSMMHSYNKVSVHVIMTVQLYRTGQLEYLKACHAMATEQGFKLGVKLVRGAYMEKERLRARTMGYTSPIQPDKEHTDIDYNLAQRFCITNRKSVLLISGTHNEQSCRELTVLLAEVNDAENVWFAQLLGMSDNLSFNLAAAGLNVAKYLPFGPLKAVMPYLFRRAEENTAIAGQMSREFRLLRSELKRRKAIHS